MDCKLGLRERKKAATRIALSNAAVRLTREHGIDAVTVDAIAEAADVSTRTFHNYFSSKEEAVLAHGERIAQRWAAVLRNRPADEDIWDSIEFVLRAAFTGTEDSVADSLATAQIIEARIIESNPALLAVKGDLQVWAQDLLCRAIAERTGTDAATDLYPRLVNLTVFGACSSAVDLWTSGNAGELSLEELICEALAQVRAGLPHPSHDTPASTTQGQDR